MTAIAIIAPLAATPLARAENVGGLVFGVFALALIAGFVADARSREHRRRALALGTRPEGGVLVAGPRARDAAAALEIDGSPAKVTLSPRAKRRPAYTMLEVAAGPMGDGVDAHVLVEPRGFFEQVLTDSGDGTVRGRVLRAAFLGRFRVDGGPLAVGRLLDDEAQGALLRWARDGVRVEAARGTLAIRLARCLSSEDEVRALVRLARMLLRGRRR
jgi:hypothetical protein